MEIIKLNFGDIFPKNYTGIVEWENGDKYWYKNGLHHREDGPAIIGISGFKAWWIDGKKHRTDGPAIEYTNGGKEWCIQHKCYILEILSNLVQFAIFLDKEKGKYDLYWLRFLTENQGIKEFPIIPGMDLDKVEGYEKWTMTLLETE